MLEMMRDHCVEELVLAPKSRVERSDGIARGLRKLHDRDRFEIVVLEQLESGLDERVVCLATTQLLDSSYRRNGDCCGCHASTIRESGFCFSRASGLSGLRRQLRRGTCAVTDGVEQRARHALF